MFDKLTSMRYLDTCNVCDARSNQAKRARRSNGFGQLETLKPRFAVNG